MTSIRVGVCARAGRGGVARRFVPRAAILGNYARPAENRLSRFPCAFRILVRIEMIDVFVALGQRAFDGVPCPSGSPGCDSISAVVSRPAPSRGSRASPPAARPQAPVRRKRVLFLDLRPGAMVLAFAALAGMASRTPPRAPGDRGPLAPTRLPPVLALEQPIAVAWTSAQ